MKIIPWEIPLQAAWSRALILDNLTYNKKGFILTVRDEEEKLWELKFKCNQAFRVTTEECSTHALPSPPNFGGLFKILDSPWITELGKGEVHFLEKSQHFVVYCYDEVVEVIAWDCEVTPINSQKPEDCSS